MPSRPPHPVAVEPAEPPDLTWRWLPAALQRPVDTEALSGVALLVAALVALAWANSPWRHGYEGLWSTGLTVRLGGAELGGDLRHWVNEALMAWFFFAVGLEIKRELVVGDLRDARTAALPAFAALGGMLVPAATYLVVTAGGPGSRGWGIPLATDIAFALGVVALLGRRVPSSLRLFLLSLAVVDDIGAIVVIAAVYSAGIDGAALALAGVLLAVIVAIRRAGVTWAPLHLVLAIAVWLATDRSGVHATIAGVALGVLTPARPPSGRMAPGPAALAAAAVDPADGSRHVPHGGPGAGEADRLLRAVHPWTSLVVLPVFALANAGVRLDGSAFPPTGGARTVAVAVGLGLVVGKLVGVTSFTWLAVRLGLGALPAGVRWPHVAGIAGVAGVGFTVSLFVAGLAFEPGAGLEPAAKVAVLVASAVAAAVGSSILLVVHRRQVGPP